VAGMVKKIIIKGYEKFRQYEKFFIFFLYLALFVVLIIYSRKYFSDLVRNVEETNLVIILAVFAIQLLILYLCGLRLHFLLKPFNSLKLRILDSIMVYTASGIFKYIPPKGVNYYMRIKMLNKINHIKGKITSSFGEFIGEFYLSSISALIIVCTIMDSTILLKIVTIILVLMMTYYIFKPLKVNFVLDFLKFRSEKIKKLLFYLDMLVRKKEYYVSLLLTISTILLHGLGLYLILSAIGISHVSIIKLAIIFYSGQFLSMIFMAPAGLGVRDLSIITLLVFEGVKMGDAVSVSLFYRAIIFVAEIAFGIFSLFLLKFNWFKLLIKRSTI
jgi:uncharacterized protein (TIRG00374 family)